MLNFESPMTAALNNLRPSATKQIGDRMPTPANPNELRRLEGEAHECERSGDFLGALDIYEEIVRRGWALAHHMTALGYCYVKNRQRQNAKEMWLRALELEPANKLCREALDKYFPGWERQPAEVRLERQKEMAPPPPPPPPPASFGQELSVETTSVLAAPAPRKMKEPASRPEPRPAPAVDEFAPTVHLAPPPEEPKTPSRPASRAVPASTRSNEEYDETRVNWDFVMKDVAEEAAHLHLHHTRH